MKLYKVNVAEIRSRLRDVEIEAMDEEHFMEQLYEWLTDDIDWNSFTELDYDVLEMEDEDDE